MMSVFAFLVGLAGIALMVICIFLSGNGGDSTLRHASEPMPRYAIEFGQLVDDLAAQYVNVLSRGQVLDAALVAVTARLAAGPIPVGDAGCLPTSLRSSIICAVDAAAERVKP